MFFWKIHKISNFIQDQFLITSDLVRFPKSFKFWFHSWHSISESKIKTYKVFPKHHARLQSRQNAISHLHQNLKILIKMSKCQILTTPPKTSNFDPPRIPYQRLINFAFFAITSELSGHVCQFLVIFAELDHFLTPPRGGYLFGPSWGHFNKLHPISYHRTTLHYFL